MCGLQWYKAHNALRETLQAVPKLKWDTHRKHGTFTRPHFNQWYVVKKKKKEKVFQRTLPLLFSLAAAFTEPPKIRMTLVVILMINIST
jgi:hypothetical protein